GDQAIHHFLIGAIGCGHARTPDVPAAMVAPGEYSRREQTRPRWCRWGLSSAYHTRGRREIVAEQGHASENVSPPPASRGPNHAVFWRAVYNPSPRPPPRSGEGEKDQSAPPLRFGEGAGGRGLQMPSDAERDSTRPRLLLAFRLRPLYAV